MAHTDRTGILSALHGWLVLPLIAALMAGCGGCKPEDPELDEPVITSFSVDPAGITRGESATLSWATDHAVSIEIADEDGGLVDLGEALAAEGSVTVSPDATIRYILTATGEEGTEPVTAELTLTVVDPDAPVVISFFATPSEILGGSQVVLSWETTGGESIGILDGSATALTLGDVSAGADTFAVNPTETTTYTLTVTGAGGQATADTTVTVRPAASVVSFTAVPNTPVIPGTEVTLSWETDGALLVTLLAGEEVIHSSDTDLDGSQVVIVDLLTEYTLVAEGWMDSEDSATVIVPVIPIVETFTADAAVVRPGDMVTFNWKTLGAETVQLTGPGGIDHQATGDDALLGQHTVAVTSAGTFTLTAVSGTLDDFMTLQIDVSNVPRIVSLTATPEAITVGGITSIAWVTQGSTSLTLEVTGIGAVDLGGRDLGSDHVDVTLTEPGQVTATLTAINADGEAQTEVTIEVVAMPVVESLSAMPERVGAGESVELSWQTSDAVSVRIEKNGVDLGVDPGLVNGSTIDTVDSDAGYVVIAANSLGYEVSSAALMVTIAAPEIVSFDASASHVGAENQFSFSWQNIGGNQLFVRLGDQVVCQSTTESEIASGSCDVTAPAQIGSYVYLLEVSNGAGSDTAELEIYVSDGPIITSFEVSAPIITFGESFEITWSVTGDATGVTPTLTLVDDLAGVYDLAAIDPNQGSALIEPDALGARTYTFTASTVGTTDATREFVVEVVAAPVIVAFTGVPLSIDTQGGTVTPESTLSWTVEDAVSLSVHALDAAGDLMDPALHLESGLDPALVAAGSLMVNPAATTRYRLSASNAAERVVTANVRVVVDGANILFFTADPQEVIAGETVTLQWETERADSVSLVPADPNVTEVLDPFIDISATGTQLSFPSEDDSLATLTFPAGFVFPYYGIDRTEMKVSTNGLLILNMASTTSWAGNALLPSYSSTRSPTIAPFWDDLHLRGTGQAFWQHFADPAGDYLIVQFSAFQFFTSTGNPANLNFEVIFHASGEFEFRYGEMAAANQALADGSSATIGFENDDGTEGFTVLYNTAAPGGLSNRGMRFGFDVPLSGDYEVLPTADSTYTLTAYSAQGDDTASVDIIVHPAVTQPTATVTPAEIEIGDEFSLNWSVSRATRVQVLDVDQNVLCDEVMEPAASQSGSCAITAPMTPASYTYTVVATGSLVRDQQSRDVVVMVRPVFSILSFEPSAEFIGQADPVALTWTTIGAASGNLVGGFGSVPIAAGDLASGSFNLPAFYSTSQFTLTIQDGTLRSRSETITIYVDAASVDSFAASDTTIAQGETVTLSWGTTNAGRVTIGGEGGDISVSEISAPLIDISGTGTLLPVTGDYGSGSLVFPAGFTFPYYGVDRTQIRVTSDGFLSFNMTASATSANTTLPNYVASRSPVIAPFWDDLVARQIYWQHQQAEDRLIIHYHNAYRWSETSGSLNFQLILYGNGTFEYRYGTMTSPTASNANGEKATIGFENDTGTEGHLITFDQAVVGGLTGKAWRFSQATVVASTGTLEVNPEETTTYEICATGGGYTDCQQVTVVVIAPGMFMVSELMPLSSVGLPGQWIEIHNTTPAAIDLLGWTLGVDLGEHVIASSVVVEPGGYVVLGRSGDTALNGGYVPDYVYGVDLTLGATGSAIELLFGTLVIDGFTYGNVDWDIVEGQTLSLQPHRLTGNPADNDEHIYWCAPTTTFGTDGQLGSPGAENADLDCGGFVGIVNYTSTPNLAIPDNNPTGVSDVQTVTEACIITNLTVDINLTHTWIEDLVVRLTAPDGTNVTLHNQEGLFEDLIGNYPNSPPHGLQFEPLDPFIGLGAAGQWTMFVSDSYSLDTGTLNSWTLNITCG